MNEIITFALAKGRLAEKTAELLEKCNIDCKNILEPTRKLELFSACGKYRFIFVKPTDVPTYVESGVADLGVCGSDTLLESCADVYELGDLKFAECRLCLAGFEKDKSRLSAQDIKIATKYPRIAEKLFFERGQNIKVIKLNGSVELGPIIGLSDFILDIVESGKTLQENGLVVLEEVKKISARLIVNKVSFKTLADKIRPLVQKIERVLC